MKIYLRSTKHKFRKKNLIGKADHSDDYECELCGLRGNRPGLAEYVNVDGRFTKKARECDGSVAVKRLQVVRCSAFGKAFENATPGSIHDIVKPPDGNNNHRGEWIMGNGEPILLLNGEYRLVD